MNTLINVDDETLMPFGEHKGKKMANVPARYLTWIKEQMEKNPRKPHGFNRELLKYINRNLDAFKLEK
jgi:uncharacterized protein (DUF3820 family)